MCGDFVTAAKGNQYKGILQLEMKRLTELKRERNREMHARKRGWE